MLRARVAEHAGRSSSIPLLIRASASMHADGCDVDVVLDNFSILNSTSSLLDLRILDSLFIITHKPKLNNTQSCFPLKIVNS